EVAVDELPRCARVVRPPESPGVSRRAVPRDAVTRLDLRVEPLRVGRADADRRLAVRLEREAVPREPLPRRAAVGGLPDAASLAAALATPRVDLDLPRGRVERARIPRVEDHIHRTRSRSRT